MSDAVMSIFRRYDPNMSAAGCDEGYLKSGHVVILWTDNSLLSQYHAILSKA